MWMVTLQNKTSVWPKTDEKAFSITGIRKIQVKTVIRSFYILAQRVTFKMTGNTLFWQDCGTTRILIQR